jgi:hypothetical protein
MGRNPDLGHEAVLSGLWHNFMNLLIINSHFFGKHIKSSVFHKCNHLLLHCSNVSLTVISLKQMTQTID